MDHDNSILAYILGLAVGGALAAVYVYIDCMTRWRGDAEMWRAHQQQRRSEEPHVLSLRRECKPGV